jgi:hypothetical protein
LAAVLAADAFAAGAFAPAAFTEVFAVFLVGIVLLLFFEDFADARTSLLAVSRLAADAFLVPLSLDPLVFL